MILASEAQDPRNQAPGMGSTENALPLDNQFADDRRYYTDMSEDATRKAIAGYGTSTAGLMMPPNYAALAMILGGQAYGHGQALRGMYGAHKARGLGYQGN